jgi:hypothetical protein
MKRKANRWWPGWDAELIELPTEVLVSESKSRMYEGLWLREPWQYLYDAMPRAQRYVQRFPAPHELDYHLSLIRMRNALPRASA